jgi:ABC-type branched-subunit amino acid transport system substrate-binding protein
VVRSRLAAFCLLSLLVTAACGSRLPSDTLAQIDAARSGGSATAALQGAATDAGLTSGGTSSGGSGQATGTGSGSQAAGGNVSGPAAGGPAAAQAAPACTGARSGAPGVTDKEIKVASIVTDSGPLPGATEGSYRGAASYFAMVNAQGGVCGRKITLLKGDDGLDPAKARSEFLRLEPDVFAFTGAFAVADSGYLDLIKSTGAPYVSLVVDPHGRDFHNVMPRTTANYVSTGPYVWWKKQHPGVTKAALLYADVGGVAANIKGTVEAMKQAGFQLAYPPVAANVASPDYTPEVRQAQDAGVQFLYLFAFEVNMQVRFVRNMRQQNYNPPIKGANIAFNTRFSQLLGRNGDGWENNTTYLLFLDPAERARSAALAQFVDWNSRVFPGAQLDLFPESGWGHAAMFVDALKRVRGTITRDALIKALYQVPRYDAGGMEPQIDPSTGLGPPCWAMAVHRNGGWVREYPSGKLFECNIGKLYKFQ